MAVTELSQTESAIDGAIQALAFMRHQSGPDQVQSLLTFELFGIKPLYEVFVIGVLQVPSKEQYNGR